MICYLSVVGHDKLGSRFGSSVHDRNQALTTNIGSHHYGENRPVQQSSHPLSSYPLTNYHIQHHSNGYPLTRHMNNMGSSHGNSYPAITRHRNNLGSSGVDSYPVGITAHKNNLGGSEGSSQVGIHDYLQDGFLYDGSSGSGHLGNSHYGSGHLGNAHYGSGHLGSGQRGSGHLSKGHHGSGHLGNTYPISSHALAGLGDVHQGMTFSSDGYII